MGSRPSNLPGQNTERADSVSFVWTLVSGALMLLAIVGIFGWLIVRELSR